jgi:hypothetical protein
MTEIGDQIGELHIGAGYGEALRIREPLERDAEGLAHGAAGAVGGDDEGRLQLLRSSRALEHQSGALGLETDPDDPGTEAQLHVGLGLQAVVEHPYQVLLVELQTVGVSGLVGEEAEVEERDESLPSVTKLVRRHDEAFLVHLPGNAERLEQLQGGRVEGARPPVRLWLRMELHDHDRKAFERQSRGGRHADRSCAHHDDRAPLTDHGHRSRTRHMAMIERCSRCREGAELQFRHEE